MEEEIEIHYIEDGEIVQSVGDLKLRRSQSFNYMSPQSKLTLIMKTKAQSSDSKPSKIVFYTRNVFMSDDDSFKIVVRENYDLNM